MKQSINHETRSKPWCEDCIFVDDMADGQTRYVNSGDFIQAGVVGEGLKWFINCDVFTSPYKRGVHDTLIKREGDSILVRDDLIKFNRDERWVTNEWIKNSIPVIWRPYTREEKIDILWQERRGQ